jgi:hypothetical protein
LLKQLPNPSIHETALKPSDLIKEPDILKFFMEDIDSLLENYEPGRPENKPDVTKQLIEIREQREKMIQEHMLKQAEQQQQQQAMNMMSNPTFLQNKLNEQTMLIQQLSLENNQLKEKLSYLEDKIKQLITEKIQTLKSNRDEISSTI